MSKKLKIGIIGAGRIGKLHANNLVNRVPDAELVAVSDVYAPAAKELAEKLNIPKWYDDYRTVSYTHLDVYKRQASCGRLCCMTRTAPVSDSLSSRACRGWACRWRRFRSAACLLYTSRCV